MSDSIARQFFVVNVILLALSVTMALVLGVVCIMYAVYKASEPTLQQEFPFLLVSTLWFCGLTLVSAFATWAMRRGGALRWPGQGLLAAAIAALVLFYLP